MERRGGVGQNDGGEGRYVCACVWRGAWARMRMGGAGDVCVEGSACCSHTSLPHAVPLPPLET